MGYNFYRSKCYARISSMIEKVIAVYTTLAFGLTKMLTMEGIYGHYVSTKLHMFLHYSHIESVSHAQSLHILPYSTLYFLVQVIMGKSYWMFYIVLLNISFTEMSSFLYFQILVFSTFSPMFHLFVLISISFEAFLLHCTIYCHCCFHLRSDGCVLDVFPISSLYSHIDITMNMNQLNLCWINISRY